MPVRKEVESVEPVVILCLAPRQLATDELAGFEGMRVLGGGEVSHQEVEDLAFEATGELQTPLNEAYIKLLEFAYDCDARLNDRRINGEMRVELQQSLDKIVRLATSRSH